jgi:acyl-CoA thioesterase-2
MTKMAAVADHQPFDIEAAIALVEIGADRFRAAPVAGGLVRPFGGHVLALALSAAQRTVVAERPVVSAHSYFVRSARIDRPLDLQVTRESDGRSFSHRRVTIEQDGRLILTQTALFHQPENGGHQQAIMPDVPAPETLPRQQDVVDAIMPTLNSLRVAFWGRDLGIDFRSVEPYISHDPPVRPAFQNFWFRITAPVPDDPATHQRLLTYASDYYLMHTGLLPLGISWCDADLQDISLDHTIWFHEPFRADEWLLYAMDSPWSGGARTLARGSFFTRDGRLVASIAQEGLIRMTASG